MKSRTEVLGAVARSADEALADATVRAEAAQRQQPVVEQTARLSRVWSRHNQFSDAIRTRTLRPGE